MEVRILHEFVKENPRGMKSASNKGGIRISVDSKNRESTVVSKFYWVCSHQKTCCVYREKMSSDSETLMALNFDNIC